VMVVLERILELMAGPRLDMAWFDVTWLDVAWLGVASG